MTIGHIYVTCGVEYINRYVVKNVVAPGQSVVIPTFKKYLSLKFTRRSADDVTRRHVRNAISISKCDAISIDKR